MKIIGTITLGVILVATVAAAGLALSTGNEGDTDAISDASDSGATVQETEEARAKDTQWYADRYGVTPDEAARRLELGPEISMLQSELRRNESETFAGLWLEHTPTYRVVAQFTDNGIETIRPYIQDRPLSQKVEVRRADLSEATLIESQDSVVELVDELGIDNDSRVDIRNNQVEFYVLDKAGLNSELNSRGVSLAPEISVVQVESLSKPAATEIYGGLEPTTCTTGFSVTDGTDEGVTTAGHCNNSQAYDWTSLTYEGGTTGGTYDIQWHSTTSLTVRNIVYDGTRDRFIYDEELWEDQYVGQSVCMYGRASGGNCGAILSTTFDQVNVQTDISVQGGDSGGPFFWSDKAFGTTISYSGSTSIYGPVDHIKNILGLELILE